MNEVSNGPTGNQEYVEFVVVSDAVTYDCNSPVPPCIDIRGWIFDDNSGYHGNDGIAQGAVRFSQDPIWSCVPLGTIIVLYNNGDRNPALPADDLSLTDGNCSVVAPLNSTLFESNITTPGAVACSYPATGWTPGGNWNNTVLANIGDCARIVNLAGCEVFSVCYGGDTLNNLIYFSGTGGQRVFYFNDSDPTLQSNWTSGSASPSPGDQTPGAPNNAANATFIAQFNNNCTPITPIIVTASSTSSGCLCDGTATAAATGSIPDYSYSWYDSSFQPIGQDSAVATGLCAGTYHVIATSHINCPDTASVTIVPGGSVSLSVPPVNVCSGGTATLTAIPSDPGGQFSWSFAGASGSSVTFTPITTTTYSCTYTLGSCSTTAFSTVTVNPMPAITLAPATSCAGTAVQLVPSVSLQGGNYSWSPGGQTTPTITVNPVSTTNYTVTYDLNGCSATTLAAVTVRALPQLTLAGASVCSGSSATLSANASPSGGTYLWQPGGQTTSSVTVTPASTSAYTVTYTESGCSTSSASTVTVVPLPSVAVNGSSVCPGQTANLSASGASSYVWSTGATTSSISVAPAATSVYTVTGTANGCVNSATATVTLLAPPVVSVSPLTICPGASGTLTATGATSYLWNNGATSSSITVTPASSTAYTVIGYDGNCYDTATATVTVGASLIVSANSASICPGQSATLTATGASSYTWSNGMTTASITVSPAASASYTVTGFSGACSASGITTVTVNSPPVLSVNDFTICPGQPAVLSASGAAGYAWSNGATSASVSVQPASTTTYTVTGTGATGCTATATATAFVLPAPVVTVADDTICSGQAASLTAVGATSYLWSNGATTATINVSPASTASYTVIGTSGGCTDTASGRVTVSAPPVVSVNSANVCNGQSATLTASGAAAYLWSSGSTGASLTVSPTQTTSYSVTGTTSGCSATTVSTVSVLPSPTITVSQATVCEGQSATVTASGASSYSWNTGSTGTSLTVAPSVTTVYTVTGTTAGCSSTATSTVTVNPLPVLQVNSPVICPGSTAVISVSGAASYQWSNGFTGNTISVTPAVTSGYTVTGTTGGCSTYAVATVTVSNLLSVDAGERDTVCYGASIQLSASPALPGCTYSWTPSAGLSSVSVSNPTANPLSTTVYVVTVVDANGCSGTDWVIVEVDSGFSVSATAVSERCAGSSDGQINLTQSYGIPPFSYAWSNGATSSSVSGLPAGSYSVTVADLAGCTATASVNVSSPAVLSFSPGNFTDVTCNGSCDGMAAVSATGGTGSYVYSWPSFPLQSGPSLTGICEGSYQCTVTDANGCTASLSFTIVSPPPFSPDSVVSSTPCNGGSTNLQVIAGGIAGAQFIWTPATGLSDSSVFNPVASPSTATTYTVTVVDANGCQSAPVTVNVPAVSSIPIVTSITGDSVICSGESVVLSATATAGNGGPYTFSWIPSIGLSDPSVPNPVSTPDSTVTYTVTVSDGCTVPQSVSFTLNVLSVPVPALSVGNSSGCVPLCVSFSAAVNTGMSYSWDFGDGGTSTNGPQQSHCYSVPGLYDIGLTVSTPQGCSSDTSLPGLISVSLPPDAGFSVSSSEVTVISPSVDFTDRSTGNPVQWQWDFGDGTFSSDQNPSHTFFSDTAGVYEVQLMVANFSGCTDTVSLYVEVRAEMSFYMPNCFTPNGDGTNEVFSAYGRGIKEYHLMIFDRWGDLIWQTQDIQEGWNGIANDGVLMSQQDAFDWKVILTDVNDRQRIYLGRVSIVK